MNRFHLHLNVSDLAQSTRFYTALFGAPPSVEKPDYAKWMLEDPRVNFAISTTGRSPGIDHLGIQAETAGELAALGARLQAAGGTLVPEAATTCCYARSDKLWTEDPQGTRWETFHTTAQATTYYAAENACASGGCSPGLASAPAPHSTSCCAPAACC
jgi:catechol 2,3-dioxygenase-like lactoylglutathione lyase family enzyme